MNSTKERKHRDSGNHSRRSTPPPAAVLDLNELERRLFEERRELIKAFTRESLIGSGLGQGWDERDSPSEDELREVEFARRDLQHRRLNDVDEALERLKAGVFSICVSCGGKIGPRRLESDPATSVCIDCAKTLDEPPPSYCY